MKKFISILLCLTLLISVSGCSKESSQKDKRTIVVTNYPTYDWTKNLLKGTDNIEVKYLVDSSVDMHSYSPSVSDIVEYENADLILYIGGESEEWIEDINNPNKISLMNSVETKKEELVEGMEGESEDEEDEHIWLSLKNAQTLCKVICDKLIDMDKENEKQYSKNLDVYINQLNELDNKYQNIVNNSSVKTLIFGDRFPFRYLLDDYGLSYYGAFKGCSTESSASFETIVFLAQKTDELNLKVVCTIGNNEIAQSIIDNTNNKDQKIVVFDSIQSISNKECDDTSYIKIMENNLESLKLALGE